ncbi:MAG: polysaccharide deacetylase family protein [Thiobacillus sp.]|nr:polysaccharide deacetylase family protein [Thiobacillus sp.]
MNRTDPVSYLLHRAGRAHGPLMLMYHAVAAGKGAPDWPWAVSMQRFRAQLDFLADAGYRTPTMRQLLESPERFAGGRTAVITFDDGYVDNLYACEALVSRSMHASWFVVSGSVGREPAWPDDGRPRGRMLNAAELREMHAAGMEIGSHTVSHARLTEVDDASLHTELAGSRRQLEDALGQPVTSFAYPYGAWDARCANAVAATGYAAACTTRTGWALRDGDPYRLRRLTVFNVDTPGSFARKLAYASHAVSWPELGRYYAGSLLRRFRG